MLFVHGALGTPLGWVDIVDRLDPVRFQPWFYYYPSGLSLEKTGAALNWMVNHLHRHYGFRELYVVAHSMGGLVARSFILKNGHENRQDIVKRFVSISTPWNGHTLTAKGVRQAPAAVPSWHDMVPESPFIRSIFARRLPESVTYDLFFSYRGDCSLFLENNDGTVELASELDMRGTARGPADLRLRRGPRQHPDERRGDRPAHPPVVGAAEFAAIRPRWSSAGRFRAPGTFHLPAQQHKAPVRISVSLGFWVCFGFRISCFGFLDRNATPSTPRLAYPRPSSARRMRRSPSRSTSRGQPKFIRTNPGPSNSRPS